MMKLINTMFDLEIEMNENEVCILSVESPVAYRKVLNDIWSQCNGYEGSFILSENNKELKIQKNVGYIYDPFAINLNDKKILSKLYQELSAQSEEMLQEDSILLRKMLIGYFDKLINTVPYDIIYKFDFEMLALIKALEIQIDTTEEKFIEKITQYMRVMQQLCGVNIFICLNLKYYFTEEELKLLYESVYYNKIHLIIIESIHTPHVHGEKCWILDKDLCIIEP